MINWSHKKDVCCLSACELEASIAHASLMLYRLSAPHCSNHTYHIGHLWRMGPNIGTLNWVYRLSFSLGSDCLITPKLCWAPGIIYLTSNKWTHKRSSYRTSPKISSPPTNGKNILKLLVYTQMPKDFVRSPLPPIANWGHTPANLRVLQLALQLEGRFQIDSSRKAL